MYVHVKKGCCSSVRRSIYKAYQYDNKAWDNHWRASNFKDIRFILGKSLEYLLMIHVRKCMYVMVAA